MSTKIKILLSFLLGVIISGVSVYAATQYLASDVVYNDTTVESALDELYNRSINKISLNIFGTPLYNQSMGNIIYNRNTSINLTKGKYIINALYGVAWSNYEPYQAIVEDSAYVTLSSTSGVIDFNKISGKIYKISGNSQFETDKAYDVNYLESSIYYVDVTSDEATINLAYLRSNYTDNVQAQTVALQAIPIN